MVMMTGSKAIVEALRCEGVEYVFGLPGSTELQFLSALEDCPEIKYILGLHERQSAGTIEVIEAADRWAREIARRVIGGK